MIDFLSLLSYRFLDIHKSMPSGREMPFFLETIFKFDKVCFLINKYHSLTHGTAYRLKKFLPDGQYRGNHPPVGQD